MKKLFAIIVTLLVGAQIYFASWMNRQGDVYFNEDIARDLLLLEQIITTHDFTLIGPRTLGIPGLFHGPLWIYLNLPAYVIGNGNPIVIGFFWLLLYVLYLGIVFVVAKKLFDTTIALLSVLLLSSVAYSYIFNNTFGALLLFPLFFYSFVSYLKHQKIRTLLISLFILGIIIQFEMAFGGPLLLITLFFQLYFLAKKKKLRHLWAFFIVLLPLSNYLLFEIRHNFIQFNSLIGYFNSPPTQPTQSFFALFSQRINIMFYENIQFLAHHSLWMTMLVLGIFAYAVFAATTKKEYKKYKTIFATFFMLYVGYWVVTLVYKGEMWLWYYYEFLPLWVILFCATYRLMNKYLFIIIFLLFYLTGINAQLATYKDVQTSIGNNHYSWQLYAQTATQLYTDAPKEFGYYISEHDDLGYRTRYALHYLGRSFAKTGKETTKMQTTYLVYDKIQGDKWWKEVKVRIKKDPVKKISVKNLNLIERYQLNEKEITTQSDPNLINSLFFR